MTMLILYYCLTYKGVTALFSMLNCDTANVKRVTGYNNYGEAEYSSIDKVKCKIEYKFKRVIGRNGVETVSSGSIRTEKPLNYEDKVEINGEYRDFIEVQPQTDFSGKTVYWIGWF